MNFDRSGDDSIGIWIHQVDLAIANYVRKCVQPYGLAPEQTLIMLLLWERDGIKSNELVLLLNKDKAGIARMVTSLERKGFVKKVDDLIDKRTFKVHLTDAGKRLADLVRPVRQKIIDTVSAGISAEEVDQLQTTLAKIVKNISMDNERSRPTNE